MTLEELMGLRHEDTDEADPNADEDPTRGSSQWRERLLEQASASFHGKHLSAWAVGEAAYFAEAFDLRVDVTASGDWQKPTATLRTDFESIQKYFGDC